MGLATAQLLASRGAIICLADLNEKSLETALASLKGSEKHMSEVVDVRSPESINAWIGNVVKRFDKIDGAVNMAGVITPAVPITEQKVEDWDLVFAVNARGVFNCLKAQLGVMAPGGSIVSRFKVACAGYDVSRKNSFEVHD